MITFEKPYETADIRVSQEDVLQTLGAFADFCDELPYEERARIWYPGDERRNTSAGYVNKSQEGNNGNANEHGNDGDKHVFHYTDMIGVIAAAQWDTLPQVTRDFLDQAQDLHKELEEDLRDFYAELEWEHSAPGLVDLHFPRDGVRNHHTRFNINDAGLYVFARDHYDKSTATIDSCVTQGGLVAGLTPETMTSVHEDSHDPVRFLGRGWSKLHKFLGAVTDVPEAWHGGRKIENDTSERRMSAQIFGNPAYIDSSPTKDETHTPIDWEAISQIDWEEMALAA